MFGQDLIRAEKVLNARLRGACVEQFSLFLPRAMKMFCRYLSIQFCPPGRLYRPRTARASFATCSALARYAIHKTAMTGGLAAVSRATDDGNKDNSAHHWETINSVADHTVKLESAVCRRFLITKVCCFLWHLWRDSPGMLPCGRDMMLRCGWVRRATLDPTWHST